MNLLIDIGNTACKFAVCCNGNIQFVAKTEYPEQLLDSISDFTTAVSLENLRSNGCSCSGIRKIFSSVVLCSVRNLTDDFISELSLKSDNFIQVNGDFMKRCVTSGKPYPAIFKTLRPDLGADRIAAVVGARSLCSSQKMLVIDMGTAVTYDLIDGDNYLGGAISLGMNTRYRALGLLTDKIPLFNPFDRLSKLSVDQIPAVGHDTEDHLASGNIVGLKYELQGFIDHFCDYHAIITGGDARFFADSLNRPVQYIPDLTFQGLNNLANL